MTDDLGMREELSRMQVMLLQYAHLVLELRQQLPSAHERPEQIPAKLDALRSAISVSTPQHRPAAVTLDAGFGQRAHKLATPSGGPISMVHGGHSSDAVQAELQQHPPTQPPTHASTHPLTHASTHPPTAYPPCRRSWCGCDCMWRICSSRRRGSGWRWRRRTTRSARPPPRSRPAAAGRGCRRASLGCGAGGCFTEGLAVRPL